MSKKVVPPPAESASPPVPTFPVAAAGLVGVDMNVDEPGQHVETARVDLMAAAGELGANHA